MAPFSGTIYDLAGNVCIHEAKGIRLKKKSGKKDLRAVTAFDKLWNMGQRLLKVIRKNEGCANKDLAKFTRDIQSVCDKWDREE